jgi:hypothetical protein
MDFVYICRNGENEELRYSIRSLVKNFDNINLWVVGGKPNWYIGNFIDVYDTGNKFTNINNCYSAILNELKISDEFVLMNDDFFILKPEEKYEYHSGFLIDKIISHSNQYGNTAYARALNGALRELKKIGVSKPLNYDIHTPMTLKKALLADVLGLSLAPRSMYGNLFIKDSISIDDVKIYKNTTNVGLSGRLISTEDNSFGLIRDMLKETFLDKTQYEK